MYITNFPRVVPMAIKMIPPFGVNKKNKNVYNKKRIGIKKEFYIFNTSCFGTSRAKNSPAKYNEPQTMRREFCELNSKAFAGLLAIKNSLLEIFFSISRSSSPLQLGRNSVASGRKTKYSASGSKSSRHSNVFLSLKPPKIIEIFLSGENSCNHSSKVFIPSAL